MKRLHINVRVRDIDDSARFYSVLFGTAPNVRKDDYAKWMLEDPRVNFAISLCGTEPGIAHLGIQAEDSRELGELFSRLRDANGPTLDEGETVCCYARSTKQWISDPQEIAWELFQTHGEADTSCGAGLGRAAATAENACCS